MKPKVAIIGLGNIGKALVENLVKGNREIIVASRSFEDAKRITLNAPDLVKAETIENAIKGADIIIPAVMFDAEKDFIAAYSNLLTGKIFIDVSNPIAPDGNGGFKKIIGESESSGQIISGLLNTGTKLVKAFGSLGASSLSGASFQEPEKAVMFYATDDGEIQTIVEELISDSGFDAQNIGGINQSIRMEVFGNLHEFGALGKTITLHEAKQII